MTRADQDRSVSGSDGRGVVWTYQPGPNPWWRRPLRRTVARGELKAPDGHVYVVRAVRVVWPRDTPGAGVASDVIGSFLPGPAGSVLDTASSLSFRVRWGVRVYRRTPWFRPAHLVYGEDAPTATRSIRRALVLAQRLQSGRTPPPKRRR